MICVLDELQDRSSKSFTIETESRSVAGFIVRISAGEIYGYENRCPHTGVQLNWQPDQFFDIDNRFIQCGMHGALFEVESGRCIRGPCIDQSLTEMKLSIEDGVIWCEY